jgi:thiol-disulfide isomerase/thioredoxin
MPYKHLNINLLFLTLFLAINNNFSQKIKTGYWNANLQLNETTILPFILEINKIKKELIFTIHNAEEKINLISVKNIKDSFQLDFPHFHSFIRFNVKNNIEINGFWYNLNKSNNYKISFSANFQETKGQSKETCNNNSSSKLFGKWKTKFSPNTKNEEIAIGLFKEYNDVNNKLTGTFLTETGDYRFLEGKICENQFYLSCFDGSHAFFFTGKINNAKIEGTFYSGKHYQTTWISERDDLFELKNPDSITFLINKEPFKFKMKDLEGKEFIFPNDKYVNKVTIIQIMGTWCPNCLDETKFLKELYDKYKHKELEIISIAYETPTEFVEQVKKINLLKNRLNLTNMFLVGGQANKTLASEHFSMLNEIISFPTAIFINKKGEVVKIHTGFNGPGTGEIYQKFVLETEKYVLELLNE